MKNLMTKTMKTLAGQPSEYPLAEGHPVGAAMGGATQPKAACMAMGLTLGAENLV